MNSSHYRPPEQHTVDNPTCNFTGEDLVGVTGYTEGGTDMPSHQEVPIAAAEYHRRRETDDFTNLGHGYSYAILFRASLPGDEIEAARDLDLSTNEELSPDDIVRLTELLNAGWKVRWFPARPTPDGAPPCEEQRLQLWKPFSDENDN